MGEKDNDVLGLSLSLGCAPPQPPNEKLNLMSLPSSHFMQQNHHHVLHKTPWNDLFQSSDRNSETRSFLRGIDVNRAPSSVDCDEENGVSSPNSTISSISGKRSEREPEPEPEPIGDDTEAERTSCSRGSDDEDGAAGGDASRKKLRLSKEQSMLLEETFKEHSTLNPKQKLALAKQLNLRPRQVEVWFQNRRARTKLKQTEVDCEYLKRCCENLTDENRRLQKEVQELRALKLSPQLYMHMNPPTTLTMCPSCERVSSSSAAAAGSAAAAAAASNGLNRHPVGPNHQRPLPISPWATLPIHNRPFDVPTSR
ncbi:hypothetical protein Ddye_018263 [Dipteronia dyeriana]|uniref:Homeobox domain-containing protein n=1 Tax=Dipteronia dyeriana TaxID=168575 RepID=A0AAD9X0K9_9ROSI|nr:hypothetical protein Ddye_018263 [Dipteronia dyeriana]